MLKNIGKKIHDWVFPKKEDVEEEQQEIQVAVEEIPKRNSKPMRYSRNKSSYYRYYTAWDKKYFKTPEGIRHIDITADEALLIINARKAKRSIKEIHNRVDWTHNISEYTIYNWIRLYNLGTMDVALSWIIKNGVAGAPDAKTVQYLHRFVGDI